MVPDSRLQGPNSGFLGLPSPEQKGAQHECLGTNQHTVLGGGGGGGGGGGVTQNRRSERDKHTLSMEYGPKDPHQLLLLLLLLYSLYVDLMPNNGPFKPLPNPEALFVSAFPTSPLATIISL